MKTFLPDTALEENYLLPVRLVSAQLVWKIFILLYLIAALFI